MKHRYVLSIIILALFFPLISQSQITITNTDITTLLTNSEWITIDDAMQSSYDLGSASSSAQTFDFRTLTIASTADTERHSYYAPAGRTLADSFPGANLEFENTSSTVFGPYTMTMKVGGYYSIENNGAYVLGFFFNQHISPDPPPGFPYPADTSTISKWEPKDLALPLPLTLGTSRNYTSTVVNMSGETEITTRAFVADGYGTLKTPDGRTLSAIRIRIDEITITVSEGDSSRERTQEIQFIADDMTQLKFDVDTNYSGGSITPYSYSYVKKGAALGIKEITSVQPGSFRLAQNYPNPFNPTTNIKFDVMQTGFVSLTVSNLLGEQIATLVNRELSAGSYESVFDASALPSGLYFYTLKSGSGIQTKKMLLTK